MEHLKAGDIVFNAQQTKDLLSRGRTPRYARALASGTLTYNGMSAYGPGSGVDGGGQFGGGAATGSGTSTTKIAQDTGKQVVKSVDDAAKKTEEKKSSAKTAAKKTTAKTAAKKPVKKESAAKKAASSKKADTKTKKTK